jgi:hypothetical protein
MKNFQSEPDEIKKLNRVFASATSRSEEGRNSIDAEEVFASQHGVGKASIVA